MTAAHSWLFPPSGASIRFPCAGSGHAELHMPELYSYPAEEGTGAHMHGEACQRVGVPAEFFRGHVFNGIEVGNEQIEHVQNYVDVIRHRPGDLRFIELRLDLFEISVHLFGTADSVIYDFVSRTLFVDDFKYGFDSVSAVNNLQLWIYATMALKYLREKYGVYPELVQFGIHQPRAHNSEDLLTQTVTANDVIVWRDGPLTDAVRAAENPLAKRTAGKHCKYCKAKITCPEYSTWSGGVIQPPLPLTDESIHQILQVAPTVKKLAEEATAYGIERRQRGIDIPGTKLVRKIKHRLLDNKTEVAIDLINAGGDREKIFKQEVKTPSQLEKIFKGDDKLIEIINEHTIKPVGDVTLALLDDNRPAIATTSEKFKNVKL